MMLRGFLVLVLLILILVLPGSAFAQNVTRLFIFAGQSNMEGADAHAREIDSILQFKGAGDEQPKVRYRYIHGPDQEANRSLEWIPLQPDRRRRFFGPELTFARTLNASLPGRLAIVKSAWGGTTLASDWDPDKPSDKDLFARTMRLTRDAIKDLKRKRVRHELSGFFWHQGENDMLSNEHLPGYGKRLESFINRIRQELESPQLPFFVGEISDKGIWGLDHRRNMQKLRRLQRAACEKLKGVHFVPTSHLDFKVTDDGHPHYHFGTEGQLQHGVAYARAYLEASGKKPDNAIRGYGGKLPIKSAASVRVFIVAGQRTAEGDRSYTAELRKLRKYRSLASPQKSIPYRFFVGGGADQSEDWLPLQPAGLAGTFGPELSLGRELDRGLKEPVVILKITDSAAVLKDWLPDGKNASRPVFNDACDFVTRAMKDLKKRGYRPRLDSLFWIPGEHDIFWAPFRNSYDRDFSEFTRAFRNRLKAKKMRIFVARPATGLIWGEAKIGAMNKQLTMAAKTDRNMILIETDKIPFQQGGPTYGTLGSVSLGKALGDARLKKSRPTNDRRR